MKDRRVYNHPDFALSVCPGGAHDFYVAVSVRRPVPDWAHLATGIYGEVRQRLDASGLAVVHERIFGSLECRDQVLAGRLQGLGADDLARPLTYVQGHPLWGMGLAGIQIQAVRVQSGGAPVRTLYDGAVPCGRAWKREGTAYFFLQNLDGSPAAAQSGGSHCSAEADRMFERADRILRSEGATYAHVVRTWIYLSEILDWYAEFNEVRNAKYAGWGLMPDPQAASHAHLRLPASTGIRGDNPAHSACVMDLLAITGDTGSPPTVAQMTNRRQKDAFQYGRAFSRGACIRESDHTCIHVSGTAAIDERGLSLHPGDMTAQTQRTLDNIEALIEPVGATLKQLASATVFIKRREHAPIYQAIAAQRGLAGFPCVCVVGDVCRPELLFEMDAVFTLPVTP